MASASSANSCAADADRAELDAVVALVAALHEHEQRLAEVLASGVRLSAGVCVAQRAMTKKLGYLGGHQIIAQLADAQTGVARAMSATAEGHRKLTQLGAAVGYRFDDGAGYGDGQKDPTSALALLLAKQNDAHGLAAN